MIKNNIHFPEAIYHFRQHRKQDGTVGNRFNLEKVEGKDYPFMYAILKRDNAKVIYLSKHPNVREGRPELFLQTGKEKDSNGRWKSVYLSGIFFPDIKNPSQGYGDLGRYAEGVLLIDFDPSAGKLILMVFEGVLKVHAKELFDTWLSGGVRESCLYNNVHLDTLSVFDELQYHDR